MNDIERIITGGGMVFKKKAEEPKGNRKPKMSDFLRGTHGSGAAKMRAGFKLKKALRHSPILSSIVTLCIPSIYRNW